MPAIMNLDFEAARASQEMIGECLRAKCDPNDVENLVTKTLGVVQESGIYAGALFLLSRTRKLDQQIAGAVQPKLVALARSVTGIAAPLPNANAPREALSYVSSNFCQSIETMFLVKDLWEQTLIYARYAAKAESEAAKARKAAEKEAAAKDATPPR